MPGHAIAAGRELKRAACGATTGGKRAETRPKQSLAGVLRVQWWEANDVLKARALPLRPANASLGTGCEAGGCNRTACEQRCVGSGLWLEGSSARMQAASGIWLQTGPPSTTTILG